MSPREVSTWDGHPAEELRRRWKRETLHLYGSVDSTSDIAGELASEEDAPAGTIVIAREQKHGRGRAGKEWRSPLDAGVYLSMIFRPPRAENVDLLPLLAGLGITRELDGALSGLRPALKWPNDLIAADRKFGGVLSEAVWSEGRVRHLVVGAGINVRPLPEDTPGHIRSRATALDEVREEETPLVEVADAVVAGLEAFLPDSPPRLEPPLLDLLDRYDWLADRRVRVAQEGEEEVLPGVCVGVAPDGALLFRPDRGALRRLRSATVEPEA